MVECSPATRAARVRFPDDAIFFWTWKSGNTWNKKSFGGAGYRSRYLSHAKRALYHLSYAPSMASCPDIVKSVPGRQQSKQVFKDKLRSLNQNDDLCKLTFCHLTFDSSVGRAVDCSRTLSDIHRSLVQIRLEGFFFTSTFYHKTDTWLRLVNAAILFF